MVALDNAKTVTVADRVRALVEEVIAGTPAFVVDVNVRGNRGSQVVEVYIDSDAYVDVERLAEISRELGFLIDTEELFESHYLLNVSSPGLDRPLAVPRQYNKHIGKNLQVHFRKADESGNAEVTGELISVDEGGVAIDIPGGETVEVPFDRIIWAKVKLPW